MRTDGTRDGIPLLGEFQVVRAKFSARFVAGSGGRGIVFWSIGLSIAAIWLVVMLPLTGFRFGPIVPTLALAGIAFVAERQSVRLSPSIEISVSFLPFILAAALLGPLSAIVVGVGSLLGLFEEPYIRWLVWTGSRTLVCGAAGLAAWAAGAERVDSFSRALLVVVAASVVEVIWDVLLGAITVAIRRTGSLRGQLQTTMPVLLAAVPLYTPVLAVLVYAYKTISPLTVAFFVIPAFAAQRLFILYRQQRYTSEELAQANARLENANLSFATALVATLDARDRYTAGHSAAVAVYARDIAARLALSQKEQRRAHLCGLVHDIGKVGLPPGLLEKPGPLTLEERRQMEMHTSIGEKILLKVDDYAEIAAIVRHHHERVDGGGYPDGLHGGEIPVLSKIIAVADAYDAMTSDRPYRDAMPSRVARLRLAQAVETQFDTTVVAAFEAILASSEEGYSRAPRTAEAQMQRTSEAHVLGAA
ncbi:MAG: HD domain-containing protein [Actinobacteria bacterium]|nr:MAG: HD domain-containing protein [Actinomycetota bacterium]